MKTKISFSFLKCKKPVDKEILNKYKQLQAIDSKNLLCREHLEYAIEYAERAFKRNQNISKDFLIEIVVRASAQRQIKKAFEIFGLKNSCEIAIFGEKIPEKLLKEYKCEEIEIKTDEKRCRRVKKIFNVDDKEIMTRNLSVKEALLNIIKERMALSSIE